jgi:putative transcriptional regulator
MRDFDASCLAPCLQWSLRKSSNCASVTNVSQPVFARYLNTSESTVEKWETGAKKPSGMAPKLLTIVKKHGLQVLT